MSLPEAARRVECLHVMYYRHCIYGDVKLSIWTAAFYDFCLSSSEDDCIYWHDNFITHVDRAPQASTTTLRDIISTNSITQDRPEIRRLTRSQWHGDSAFRRRRHVGLNRPSQARWLQASFCMAARHAQRMHFPCSGPSGGHGVTAQPVVQERLLP